MNENRCVMCGDIIPEGRQVCPICEIKERQGVGMKNYQAIQKMNKKEMTAVFFMFLRPFIKDKLSEKERADLLKSIEQTLDKEVTPNGITGSEKQP